MLSDRPIVRLFAFWLAVAVIAAGCANRVEKTPDLEKLIRVLLIAGILGTFIAAGLYLVATLTLSWIKYRRR
jgi:hypothetical protein